MLNILAVKNTAKRWIFNHRLHNLSQEGALILLYHAISPTDNMPFTQQLHNVPPTLFAQQLELLQQHFTVIPLDELCQRVNKGQDISGLATITFDDGYASVINEAVPLLEHFNMHATLFVTTRLIEQQTFWRDQVRLLIKKRWVESFLEYASKDDDRFMRLSVHNFYQQTKSADVISSRLVADKIEQFLLFKGLDISSTSEALYCTVMQLESLDDNVITLGNHTVNHYVLSTLSREEQYAEIDSANTFLGNLNQPLSRIFSIPFGGIPTFNQETLEVLYDTGFEGYLLSNGNRLVHSHVDVQVLPYKSSLPVFTRTMPPASEYLGQFAS